MYEAPQPAASIEISAHPEVRLSPAPGSSGSAKETGVQLTFWEGISLTSARQAVKMPARLPPPTAVQASDLTELFIRVFRRLGIRQVEPRFKASFRRFTGLRSTIAFKQKDDIQAQISDLFEDASTIVVEAIAEILISRLFGRSPSREAKDCYKAWANSPTVMRRVEEIHQQRGRKLLLPPQGRHFNLAHIFDDLNRRFFQGQIGATRIGWSMKRSRRMLGHYDSAHHTITITRWLDAPRTPRYVVEYLVFHEMLHVRHPVERNHHQRIVHSKPFRAAERVFPRYQRAVRWLAGQDSSSDRSAWRMI